MGERKIIVRKSAAYQIAGVAFFIASKGLVKTAEKFSTSVYDFIETLSDVRKVHRTCTERKRRKLGWKCVSFRKKYTIVFIETDDELIICEFLPSKLVHW